MGENEEKGFVIKDRRKISLDDIQQDQAGDESGAQAGEGAAGERARHEEASWQKSQQEDHKPMPEVSFSTFVFSLSSSALVHLGEIPEPETQRSLLDLPMAKQIIDTLGMLDEKTRGNLDQDEERFLKSILYDLRMRYIQKSTR